MTELSFIMLAILVVMLGREQLARRIGIGTRRLVGKFIPPWELGGRGGRASRTGDQQRNEEARPARCSRAAPSFSAAF